MFQYFKRFVSSAPIGNTTSIDLWDHVGKLEQCEQRLALSSMPWHPLGVGPFELQPSPPIETPDLPSPWNDNPIAFPNIDTHLAEAHQQTGWNGVHSQFGLDGKGQTVAIIDSGIAFDHVALGRGFGAGHRVVGGWDFAENDNRPYDDAPAGFHGTHVAGIVGANDGVHFGVAPNVDLVSLRVFNDIGKGELAWTESALRWVYDNRNTFANPITTVNLSLGSSWNSSTIPVWATLEDELAQLHQAGIVVVASAGNSFQQYKTPGLAYPASSPFVIPVASIDSNSQLSDFSQRDSRVIAAPGRGIESTVPDYFFGRDGNPNDWANASGTSMAAPYVAGATVLIREAMELAGIQNITPQSIYDTLRNTANSVFDSVTNQSYRSLDLDRAIESILPRDSVGDSFADSSLLNVQSHGSLNGWINSLSDQDVYRMNATQNGEIRFQIDSAHLEKETVHLIRNGQESLVRFSNGLGSIQVNAGESIGLRISDGQSIGQYKLDWSFAASSSGTNQFPSFASIQGDTLTILGTSGANQIALDLSAGIRVDVDGATHHWNNSSIRNVVIDGVQNNDSIRIVGSTLADRIDLRPNQVELNNELLSVRVNNVENVQFVGGGGPDRAYLFDDATDDRLSLWPNKAELTGVGYAFSVEQVNRIFIHALQGGDDQAFVYDSLGNDTLSVRPQFSSMSGQGYFNYLSGFERVFAYANTGGVDRAQLYDSVGNDLFSTSGEVTSLVGSGFSTFARGFENVEAYANAGGIDRALVYAPTGGRLTSGVDFVGMEGTGRTSIARGFERTELFANGASTNLNTIRTNSLALDSDQPTAMSPAPILPGIALGAMAETGYTGIAMNIGSSIDFEADSGAPLHSAPLHSAGGSINRSDSYGRSMDLSMDSQISQNVEEALDALIAAESESDRDILDQIFGRL
jgi:hypothetical protein